MPPGALPPQEDLCEAGAVAALSQLLKAAATWTPSAQQQQVVRAALAALAVMMRHAEAALQMLKLNMMPALVPLAADGSSQALQAAASTAIQHILQHAVEADEALGWDAASRGPSKSSVPSSSSSGGGSDTHRSGPSSVSSASSVYTSDLGRACSTATVSALMVLASSSAGIIHPQLQPHSGPALYLLLHASAGSEARSGVLGNDEGMAGVLHQAGQGVLVAMRLVRRLAMDEALQPQVAQRLARVSPAHRVNQHEISLIAVSIPISLRSFYIRVFWRQSACCTVSL